MQKKRLGIVAFAAMFVAGVVACVLMLPAAQSEAFTVQHPVYSASSFATLTIEKVDDSGNPVKGAELTFTVSRENGNVETGRDITITTQEDNNKRSEWSNSKASIVTEDSGKVKIENRIINTEDVSHTIKIEETGTPEGYETADPITLEFKKKYPGEVDPDGSFSNPKAFVWEFYVNGELVEDSDDVFVQDLEGTSFTIQMVDKKKKDDPTTYEVQVSKLDEDGNFLAGAELEIFSVADDGTATSVQTLTSGDGALTVQLAEGKYRLVENSAPEGYDKADPIEFEVSANSTSPIEVKMTDKKTPTTDDDTPTPTPDPTPEPEPEPTPEPTPEPEPITEPEPTPTETTTTTESKKAEPVKTLIPATGDIAVQGLSTLAVLGAALLATTVVLKKRLLD